MKKLNIPFLDLKVKDTALRDKIDRTLLKHVDETAFIGGDSVRRFETEFADYCGVGQAVGVANGTDALVLALRSLNVGPGDEVITVPFTFIATTAAITAVGAKIKFVDVDPKTFTMDPGKLKGVIGPKTKAVIPVHLFGQPCDMDPILETARQHQLKVVEDAAQAHGAKYKEKRVGGLGDAGCFSFYPTKNLGGFGDGGAVISSSKDLIEKISQRANHGRSEKNIHALEGVNSRLDGLQAAVLRILLKELDKANARRRHIAGLYDKALAGNQKVIAPTVAPGHESVFHLYSVLTRQRDKLQSHLKSAGIGCGIYYLLPLHLQPAYAYMNHKKGNFPVAEELSDTILSLPLYPNLSDDDVAAICQVLVEF